jgi:hypothetical protein
MYVNIGSMLVAFPLDILSNLIDIYSLLLPYFQFAVQSGTYYPENLGPKAFQLSGFWVL